MRDVHKNKRDGPSTVEMDNRYKLRLTKYQVSLEDTNWLYPTYWLFKKFLHNFSNDFGMFSDVQDTANKDAQVRSSLPKLLDAVRAWWNEAEWCNAQLPTHCQYRLQ